MCTNHRGSRVNLALTAMLAAASLMASSCAGLLGGGGDPPDGTGVNKAPIIIGNTIAANLTAPETGQAVKFSVSANDPENKPVTCAWDDGNEAAGDFEGDGTSVFWSTDTAGTYTITVVIYDDQMLSASASTTITVTAAVLPPPDNNTPPVFSPDGIEGDVTAPVVGQKIIFSTSATDADGDPIEFIWGDNTGQDNFTEENVSADGVATASWQIATPGTYTITATANDGHVSSKLSSSVTTLDSSVTVAAMPATFKYMGAAYCGSCHSTVKGEWEGTAHSTMETRFQETKYARRETCRQCHALGYQDQGYIAFDVTPQFANIQCESCHGSGVGHPASGPLPTNFGDPAQSCGKCHTGARYGSFDEWQESTHATMEATAEYAGSRASCVKCHNGEWFVKVQINGEAAPTEDLDPASHKHIVCATCHDPHNAQYESQLRADSVGAVIMPTGDIPVEGGKGNICLKCHNGNRTQSYMDNVIVNGGPRGMHANSQGPLLFGLAGYDIAGVEYDKQHPHATWNENSCVTCHMWTKGYESAEDPAVFGHTMAPRMEACLTCHQGQTLESMEALKNEFQTEISLLMEEFVEVWPAAWRDMTDPEHPVLYNKPDDTKTPPVLGPPVDDPIGNQYRQAWWNWYFVEEDLSHGIHNPTYAKQLLESAIAKVEELNAAP